MFNSVDCTRCKNGQESGINVSFGDGTMWRPERNLYFIGPLLQEETDPTQMHSRYPNIMSAHNSTEPS